MPIDVKRLRHGLRAPVDALLAERHPEGGWEGQLSSSALATATAVTALAAVDRNRHDTIIRRGLDWLTATQNPDGGWGDSPDSPSNVSTTLLGLAAATFSGGDPPEGARSYLHRHAGPDPTHWADALVRAYGADRTFAAPILSQCAVAGLVPWERVPPLPFELSAAPRTLYRVLRLQVVSYALPALIAIGLARHRRSRTRNPVTRMARNGLAASALRKLRAIQPASGGFLEAIPLTSFVTMNLAAAEEGEHPVVQSAVRFLTGSARPDGSWPIDANLSVWLTTNAVLALDAAGALNEAVATQTCDWLLDQQHTATHPYTGAAPGGWAWTHLPGGVPDADDTARAVLALRRAGCPPARAGERSARAVRGGVRWLLRLQNRDGGWPTFCRGWGKLPFDRSSPDLTAHALQALCTANDVPPRRVRRTLAYLRREQRNDGSWIPLWFGSQHADDGANPVLGTAAVLPALLGLDERECSERAVTFLVGAQAEDGGWGGGPGLPPSIEETAAAVAALAQAPPSPATDGALARGTAYLLGRVEDGSWRTTTPVGLYFAKLWYSERLYPIIGVVEALGRVAARSRLPDD